MKYFLNSFRKERSRQHEAGFTLIELLVVIAVIAILTAIVLASTSASRGKGANAGVKTNLRSVMQQAELQYLSTIPNRYGTASFSLGACAQTPGTPFANETLWLAVLEIQKQDGGIMPTCVSTPFSYAVAAPLNVPENGMNFWCVDSQGNAKGRVGNIVGPTCD